MSKSRLRKELELMSDEQLRQMILDAYDVRKEIKDYFEFFINPDMEKLTEKHQNTVKKEIARNSRGRSKMRVSVLKKSIKEYMSYGASAEAVVELMIFTLKLIGHAERAFYMTETQLNYISKLYDEIIAYADTHLLASETIAQLDEIAKSERYSRYFKLRLQHS